MTLRDCTALAIAYYKSGKDYWPSIWSAINECESLGLLFESGDVAADWKLLKKRKSARKSVVDNSISMEFLANGMVKISQGGLSVILLEEEARDQYPPLFEE